MSDLVLVAALNDFLEVVMTNEQMILEGLRACVFLLGFIAGLVFVGLIGKRWFF